MLLVAESSGRIFICKILREIMRYNRLLHALFVRFLEGGAKTD